MLIFNKSFLLKKLKKLFVVILMSKHSNLTFNTNMKLTTIKIRAIILPDNGPG